MISYELALGMALIGVVLQSGTLDLYSISSSSTVFRAWGGTSSGCSRLAS